MKKLLLTLLAIAFAPALLHANGDPVISYSAHIRSCNPIPLKVTDVQVVREDLEISVSIPYSAVRVAYRLKNNSKGPIHVDYGFPIDFAGKADGPHGFVGDDMSEDLYEVGVADRAVRNIRFRLDGTELKWTRANEVAKTGDVYEDEDTGETVELTVYRLWTYTVLDIPASETAVLEVEYDVLTNWAVGIGELQSSPLSRYFPTSGYFSYDFSPAMNWGNGKADSFNCTVHFDALPDSFIGQESPTVNADAPFKRLNKATWTCTDEDFDFEKADVMNLYFWDDSNGKRPRAQWGNPLVDCAVPASAYTVKVSGAQANYPAENMQDNNPATAWVAPGNGVGAIIDIDFPKPRRVSDLYILNGYHKSDALWAANSRIKTVRLEVTRADGYRDEAVEIDLSEFSPRFYLLRSDWVPRFSDISMLAITTLNRMILGREKASMTMAFTSSTRFPLPRRLSRTSG